MPIPQVGDRVRMTGIMREPDGRPDPDPMPVGAEGTVEWVGDETGWGHRQIHVNWDNGRSLILLSIDPFVIVPGGGGKHAANRLHPVS